MHPQVSFLCLSDACIRSGYATMEGKRTDGNDLFAIFDYLSPALVLNHISYSVISGRDEAL